MKTPKSDRPLSEAAEAFEQALERFEHLSFELAKNPVRSDKSLSRVRKWLTDAGESDAELAELLDGLSKAMMAVRDRQQASMERVSAAMAAAQARSLELTALLERLTALGRRAQEVAEPVGRILTEHAAGGDIAQLVTPLREVDGHLQTMVTEADALLGQAQDGDWPELAKDVHSLQQQLTALRGKVNRAASDAALSPTITIIEPSN